MSAYSDVVLADSPIVYYRLGEPSGTTADNAEGTAARDGTYRNAPTLGVTGLLTGDADTAVNFAAASSQDVWLDTGNMPAGSSGGVSIETWAKWGTIPVVDTTQTIATWAANGTTGNARLQWRWFDATHQWFHYDFTDGTNSVEATSLDTLLGAWLPTVGVAYHIVVTHDYTAKTVTFYVNRTDIGTASQPSGYGVGIAVPSGSWLSVGSYASNYCFDGTLDEVAVYNSVLSPTRIAAHYTAGIPAVPGITQVTMGMV